MLSTKIPANISRDNFKFNNLEVKQAQEQCHDEVIKEFLNENASVNTDIKSMILSFLPEAYLKHLAYAKQKDDRDQEYNLAKKTWEVRYEHYKKETEPGKRGGLLALNSVNTVVVTGDGLAMGCGSRRLGILGLKNSRLSIVNEYNFCLIEGFGKEKIRSVYAGPIYNLYLTESGKVFFLGACNMVRYEPKQIMGLEELKVMSLAIMEGRTRGPLLVITEEQHVYYCPFKLETFKRHDVDARKLDINGENIVQAVVNNNFAAFLTQRGELYYCKTSLLANAAPLALIRCDFPCTKVFASETDVVFITAQNAVFSLQEDNRSPGIVKVYHHILNSFSANETIVDAQVYITLPHNMKAFLFLSSTGRVLTSDSTSTSLTTEVSLNKRFRAIGAFRYRWALLADDGELFIYGVGADGQLGLGKQVDYVTQPTRVDLYTGHENIYEELKKLGKAMLKQTQGKIKYGGGETYSYKIGGTIITVKVPTHVKKILDILDLALIPGKLSNAELVGKLREIYRLCVQYRKAIDWQPWSSFYRHADTITFFKQFKSNELTQRPSAWLAEENTNHLPIDTLSR